MSSFVKTGGQIVSIDAESPEDCAAGDEIKTVVPEDDEEVAAIVEEVSDDVDVIKVCETADGSLDYEPVCAPPLMAVQESCTVDSIFYPVEPVHDEDATIQSDVVCVPIEEGELPSPADVPACEKHTPIAIQHECAVDDSPISAGKAVNLVVLIVPVIRVVLKSVKLLTDYQGEESVDGVFGLVSAPVEDVMAPSETESVPVESADVPACEEPTFVPSRKELPIAPIPDRSGDLAAMSLEELSAVAAEDVSYWPNKTRWNLSFQGRHLRRLKLSLKQQAV
ncbi:hypothetical protein OUZ56_001386 [Daphnia magna]|uniref:Uncharacterized protein n=1 Tax=Daphnia magna TaxID=35525 RepID=A0ABR0A2H4_9CRUS|nr:hypothetical protein OUZ56_001386 [Daphnia magna]